MATHHTSPSAASFKSAIKRGTSYNQAVWNSANRCNKTTDYVWNSLCKANLCWRQKFNGQWVYFPCDVTKTNATTAKNCQFNMWQWYCEWCIANKCCTPDQIHNHCGSQKDFMNWCRKFWNKQYNHTTNVKHTHHVNKNKTYKFPVSKSRTNRKAA